MTLLIVMPSASFAWTGSAQTSPVKVGPRSSVFLPGARESRIIVIGMVALWYSKIGQWRLRGGN